MFRSALSKPAAGCRAALLCPRIAQSAIRAPARAITRPAPLKADLVAAYLSLSRLRFYSYEATSPTPAAADDPPTEPPRRRFTDLTKEGIHENIVNSITQGMGYEFMTDVQAQTMAPVLEGKDLVAQAKTGTGKTLAFLVPILQKVVAENPKLAYYSRAPARPDDIRCIIVSPTRELAEQIAEEARKLAYKTGIRVQSAVGGTMKRMMVRQLQHQGCHILVATPGRLLDVLQDPMSGVRAPMLKVLVLDEADRMLDVGFDRELRDILRELPDRKEQPRQALLYSATMPPNVIDLARHYVDHHNFKFVQTIRADDAPTHERVPQHIVTCKGRENLLGTLLEFMKREINATQQDREQLPFKAMVFVPTTSMVELTSQLFHNLAYGNRFFPNMYNIHSKLNQTQRTRASDQFKRSRSAILFSSDVTARGMDFPNVSHVIQLGCPPNREQYIHRLGRTGRAGKTGQGWLFLPDMEVRTARQELAGLPIQRHKGLTCADFDMQGNDPTSFPEPLAETKDCLARLPRTMLSTAYMSYLGSVRNFDKREMIASLNDWARFGWGWSEPPAISMGTAEKLGLARIPGMNIQDSRRSDYDDRGRGGGGMRSGPNRSPRSNDPFDRISYGAQRESNQSRRRAQPTF